MAKKKASAGDGSGTRVRVLDGIQSPEFPDIPIAGWSGTVVEVVGKAPDAKYMIEWDDATLKAMPPDYVQRCEAQQLYHRMACLKAAETEPA